MVSKNYGKHIWGVTIMGDIIWGITVMGQYLCGVAITEIIHECNNCYTHIWHHNCGDNLWGKISVGAIYGEDNLQEVSMT